jgi:sulfotransferase family protein
MTSFTRPIFPFVVGCSRSGTTLLRALLDAHPLLAVPPESHFVLAPDPRALRRTLRRGPWFALWGIEPPDLRGLDVADAVRAVFAAYGAAHGKPGDAARRPAAVPYPEHHGRLALAPTPGLRDWRREMSQADAARFEAVAGDALAGLGY